MKQSEAEIYVAPNINFECTWKHVKFWSCNHSPTLSTRVYTI